MMGHYVPPEDDYGAGHPIWVPDFPGDKEPGKDINPGDDPNTALGTPRYGGSYVFNPETGKWEWTLTPEPNDHEGARLNAKLLRKQFDEWERVFKPIEMNFMKQLSFNNPEVLDKAVRRGGEVAQEQSAIMGGVLERSNRSLGVNPTEQQGQTMRRLMDLNKTTNIAGAENQARENVRIQDQMILLGSAPNPNIAKGVL